MFANLTGINQMIYRQNSSEVAQALVHAMQNPATSLKQGNIISIWDMDTDVENTFTKWYCTYGAARISPEFFPFIDEKVQQRTWWGNAVDRCKNASDTGYKIWSIPSQWALIIYNAWGKFGSYGHVGKVLHYDKKLNKIIVRDMARVAKSTMSDRWEDLTTASVKCYIYASKTDAPSINIWDQTLSDTTTIVSGKSSSITTGTSHGASPSSWWTSSSVTNPPVTPPIIPPVLPPIATGIHTLPQDQEVIVPVISQTTNNKTLTLDVKNLRDIAQHFITQNNLTISIVSKSPLKLGEVATLTFEIKNKESDELYSGLLPFTFTLLSTNDTLQPSISNIQLINNGKIEVTILGQKVWTASIVISIDDKKIGEVGLEVM